MIDEKTFARRARRLEWVRAAADVVLAAPGGRGAAREMVEAILKARGEWQGIVAGFSRR